MATCVVDRSAVNSVFSRRTNDECSQYDSSEDSDEERQLVSDNITSSESFVISFSDDCNDVATSDSVTANGSTSKAKAKAKPGLSLQDAFKRFKKKKQKQIRRTRKKQKNGTKETRLRSMANPDHMRRLRKKFVDEVKRYMGVPYAKKYWKPEDPEYKSKLFLDCCGLVRRVMLNLKSDFGFRIGPWNQAYMYDTLPVTVRREEDMKPGDLVFVSATYYNPKMKKQKHSMTHVEIWLGDGVKTIGARWNKGKVQVFDSYRFKATSYHSETYIFKSIDTWLKGQCRSHCPYHTWKRRSKKFKPSRNSIFRLPQQDSGQSQSDKSTGEASSQLTEQQCSASTLDSDTATLEENAEDEVTESRETRPSLTRSVGSSGSSLSADSCEDVLEISRRRVSLKKAEDKMGELTIEEGTTDESSVCSSTSIESTDQIVRTSPKVPPLRTVLKISKIGAWEKGKNAHNVKQRHTGEPTERNSKKSLSSASRENMQHCVESSNRDVGNLAPTRSRSLLQKDTNRDSGGNVNRGAVQSRKGCVAEKEDSAGTLAALSSRAQSSSKQTKVATRDCKEKSRVHASRSDNDLQSSKTHSVVSRRPSF